VTTRTFIDPRTLHTLGSMRIMARSVVEGIITGMHRNPHRGSSVEFAEYKEYRPGDDLRHVDWRAWGRLDRFYVKQFEDETNVRCFLLLDSSGSMNFAFEQSPTKHFYGSVIAASLAYLLLGQGDAPGLFVFDERPGYWLPPSSRRTQLEDLCKVLDQTPAKGRTAIETALARVAERVHARSMVVLISDLLEFSDDLLAMARILRRRGMEVVVFHIMDPAEFDLPYEGLTVFEGMEGEGELLVDPDDIRLAYQDAFVAHADRMRDICGAGDLEYFRVRTDRPVEEALLQFVQGRRRKGAGR
jgi:uncharacterized protein (DUF58 family)